MTPEPLRVGGTRPGLAQRWTLAERAELLAELDAALDGEVHADPVSQMLYATDASIYQEIPLGVVRPRHRADCVAVVRFAARHRIPLIPRAGGTSLAGQCVGEGLVVDVSRHMTRIVSADPEARRVVVEPGVILDDLNDAMAPHGLLFGPDTSTANRCMIGGMIGNNSCGTHSIMWGTTRDHVIEVEAVLSDGSVAVFGDLTEAELEAKLGLESLEGEVYRAVYGLVEAHREAILEAYPKAEVKRRNTGYPLDILARSQPFEPDGLPFNMARFVCGTEGTLALVTRATLNLVPLPKHKLLVCAHFDTLDASMRATVVAVEHAPAAVELMDDRVLAATENNAAQMRNRFWVEGEPEAILVIELYDDDAEALEARAEALIAALKEAELGYAFPIVRPPLLGQVWALRKAGLGLLMGVPGDVKAVTVIEDTAVAVEDLPEYVREMARLMARYDTQCVYYAHASVGELHLRPELNLKKAEDMERFKGIAQDVAELVSRFKGSLSGEHGDGRLRGPFVAQMVGEEVFEMLVEVKRAFDPANVFNPNKIIDTLPIDADLRIGPTSKTPPMRTFFDWSDDHGLIRAAEKCNGAGACRKSSGRGTMCPSYMATKEERDTTRGRANIFRQVLEAPDPHDGLTRQELYDVLDLCLSCKGCASECPASVDMARMKAEFLQHYYDHHGTPLRARVFGEFAGLTRLGAWAPRLTSGVLNLGVVKRLLGVHPERSVPAIARTTFADWAAKRPEHPNAGKRGKVVLFNDAFTHFNDAHIGAAALDVLERAGYRVVVTRSITSGRTQISKGLLRRAKAVLSDAIEALLPYAEAGVPIVGIEPSAILTFRDEAPDLVPRDLRLAAQTVAAHCFLFEEFMTREAQASRLDLLEFDPRPTQSPKFMLHGHCHQKALVGLKPTLEALALIPDAQVETLPSGCCGMAGSFGYEAEHYDLSMQIGELVLFPSVRGKASDQIVVAMGTSCRHQIADGTGARAYHPAQVIQAFLKSEALARR